jgi:predicted dienelactone hydrolase
MSLHVLKKVFHTRCGMVGLLMLSLVRHSTAQSFHVGERTIAFKDASRNRPVTTEIWYPTSESDSLGTRRTDLPFLLEPTIRDARVMEGSHPLIMLSHGSGGNRYSLAWIAIELAKRGYVVAAPDHWGGTYGNMIKEYYIRYWERPLDISFLLTQLLRGDSLVMQIDAKKIGMIGFSFGGYTTLALAGADIDCKVLKETANTAQGKAEFNIPELGDLTKIIDTLQCDQQPQSFKDDRIRAFVAFAPGLGLGYSDPAQTKSVKDSVLIFAAGQNDHIAPAATNANRYHHLIASSRLVTLDVQTGHCIFLNEGDKSLVKEAKQLFRDDKSINRNAIHTEVAAEVIHFLEEILGR